MTRRFPAWLFRLLVTLLVFYLILCSIDLGHVLRTMAGVDPRLLLAALVLQLLSTLVASWRWHLVMQRLGFGQHFPFYLRSYLKGTFFNQGLPTSIGGDALRVLDVARTGHRKRDAFYGVFVDRLLGLVGLLVFNLLAHLWNPDLLPREAFLAINGVVLLGLLGFVVLLLLHHLHVLEQWRPTRLLLRISQRLRRVLANWRDGSLQLALSLLIHFFGLSTLYMIGLGVGLEYDFLTYLVVVPPVLLLTIVPISLAGWGVREGGMVGLFALLGANQTLVLSMSILYGLVLIVASLPGLYTYLSGRHHL